MQHSWPTVKLKNGENPWVNYANRQVHRRNNCINLVCTGGPGSGKSWSLLSYFCMIDPDFDLDEQCFFKAKKLMRAFEYNKILKGRPFMFDESGIDASNQNWQDEINKGLKAFFQTARHRNYIFGMTVPFMSFVSKGVRCLMNCHWKAQGWTSDNLTKIAPYVLEYNGDIDKFYWKRLLVKSPNGLDYCNEVRLPKPPKKIIVEYEKRKKEFTTNLFKEIGDKIDKQETKKENSKLYKCHILAKELGIEQHTMLSWIKNKKVKANKIGGTLWYVTQEERERLLEGKMPRESGF